jgi:hypothetical protein
MAWVKVIHSPDWDLENLPKVDYSLMTLYTGYLITRIITTGSFFNPVKSNVFLGEA